MLMENKLTKNSNRTELRFIIGTYTLQETEASAEFWLDGTLKVLYLSLALQFLIKRLCSLSLGHSCVGTP